MSEIDEFGGLCDGYDGVEYTTVGDELQFVHPDGAVGLNTVTYVQGVGLNIRAVNIPGSSWPQFFEETEDFGVCQCSPPAIWVFTAIETDGTVHLYHTLSSHEAIHILRHPDHLFGEFDSGGMHESGLPMVSPEYGLEGVTRELVDHLSDAGIGGLRDDGDMSFNEVAATDLDDLVKRFFEGVDE